MLNPARAYAARGNEHTSVYLLASTHLSILDKSGQHDNGGTLATVQHLPEVPTRALHRILSNDEGFLLFVALHRQTDRQTDRGNSEFVY